jgi:CheY-like chemotaxis protein
MDTNSAVTGTKRILVVEDEPMIRMLLEDMLDELGYTVAAGAARLDEALAAAATADVDVAILDVDLNGQSSAPVADKLSARGVPFVFSTGYSEQSLPPSHRNRPMVRKPYQMDGLGRTLANAMAAGKS